MAGDAVVGQRAEFGSRASVIGIVAAWMTFGINEVYAVLSGIVFLHEGAAVESGPVLSVMALLVVLMGPFLVLSMAAVHAFADPELAAVISVSRVDTLHVRQHERRATYQPA